MKLFVNGFSQEAVLSMVDTVKDSHGKDKTIRIDCTDLEILRWLVDFYPKMAKIKDGAHEYAFFTYKKVLEDLPILNISKHALADRFRKMEHFGILRLKCDKNKDGTFTYVGLGDAYISLISTDKTHSVSAQRGYQSAESAVVSQLPPKNSKLDNRELKNIKKNLKKKADEPKLNW
nr:MAG TPA: hypothetical protein [Bacteriophage sp.]